MSLWLINDLFSLSSLYIILYLFVKCWYSVSSSIWCQMFITDKLSVLSKCESTQVWWITFFISLSWLCGAVNCYYIRGLGHLTVNDRWFIRTDHTAVGNNLSAVILCLLRDSERKQIYICFLLPPWCVFDKWSFSSLRLVSHLRLHHDLMIWFDLLCAFWILDGSILFLLV